MRELKMNTRDIFMSRLMGFYGIMLMILSINTFSNCVFFQGLFFTVIGFAWFCIKGSEVRDLLYYKNIADRHY